MPNTTVDIKEIVNNVLTKEQYETEETNNRVVPNQFYNTTEHIDPNNMNISSEFPISGHIISYDSAIFSNPTTSFRILRNVKYSVPNGFKAKTSKLDSLVFLLTADITVTPSADGLFLIFLTDNIAQALLVPITDVGDTPRYRYHYDSTKNIWKDGENVKYFCPIGICKKQGSTVTITPLKWKVLTYSDKSLIEDWVKPKQVEVNNGTTVSIAVQENTFYKFLNKIDTLTVSSFPNSDSDSVLLFQANKDNMTIAVTGATDANFLNKLTTSKVDNKYIMSVRNGLFAVNKEETISGGGDSLTPLIPLNSYEILTKPNTEQINLGTISGVPILFWGDGTSSTSKSHTYSNPGTYTITGDITGSIRGSINFNGCTNVARIILHTDLDIGPSQFFYSLLNSNPDIIVQYDGEILNTGWMINSASTTISYYEINAPLATSIGTNIGATFNGVLILNINYVLSNSWIPNYSTLQSLKVKSNLLESYKNAWPSIADKISAI